MKLQKRTEVIVDELFGSKCDSTQRLIKIMKRKAKTKTKKRSNPADLTLRNLMALKKRVEQLHHWLEAVTIELAQLRRAKP